MSGVAQHPVVDVHAHVLLGEVEEAVAGESGLRAQQRLERTRQGTESSEISARMVAERIPQLTDPDVRRSDMDAVGVDVRLLSPSPSQYHYWAEPDLAWTVVSTANHAMAATVAQDTARFRGLGLVPLQHPEMTVPALDEALDLGLVGVEISSHAPRADGSTVELSDPGLEPFWARAARRGALVFLHPFGCTLGDRLDRFNLANTVGQPVENAVALSHLIFSGVLDRHPGLRVLAAHGGGYLPTYLGRSDHAWRVRPDARGCERLPSSYLRDLWFDSLVHTPGALRALVAEVGPDRILLGSDHPFDMGVPDPVARLTDAELSATDQHAIRTGNAELLGLARRVE
ncbi:aminocarboxymuconate-semialdehyde decarboxylase [Actinopolyspora xinjiangensis]|uniref:Aminocarboxymuconate-semialdehyde decarboxylase n=1 Tax=Actinopolyspora xinjiangensis TaxID=405564 RepID=A0A1H0S6G0_9ACTN|nr:amidohydrolase family protein [Actinopolyspora xinjiangensis]SDP37353.1 aminocarboxymuconate-semialdehyde decarboxylase [Actinopolyspora xinjiangensis]